MCCDRCNQQGAVMLDSNSESNNTKENEDDIGGFAAISGCFNSLKTHAKQIGAPKEQDLANWGHHHFSSSIPDSIFQASAGNEVSFVFTNQVGGKLAPIESAVKPRTDETNDHENPTGIRKAPSL